MTRALIVEDSPTQAAALAFELEAEGFEVEIAADGLLGLERCQREPYDVVLSDVVMPGLDGYALCERLKSDRATRHLPVILLTSLAEPMDIIRGLECGADNFITKPYEAAYVVGRVRRLLENRALRTGQKLSVGVELLLMGRRLVINSEKEQILDLLISTFEEVVAARHREQEAKLSADSHREARRLLQSALDALSAQIVIIDDDGKILAVNASWRRFIERSRGGSSAFEVGAVYADAWESAFGGTAEDKRLVTEGAEEVRAGRRDLFQLEFSARVGEEQRQIALSATRFNGRGPTLVAIEHEDITERRLAEEALRRTEDQLRQAQKMEAIGQLAGGVAHDFNNLLAVISSYSDLLLEDIAPGDPKHGDLREIQQAARRAAVLTHQLLAFSRRQILQPVVLDLNQVVGDVEKMLGRVIGEDIRLVTTLDPGQSRVKVDPGQIEQIVMNLAVNARDAMPRGGKLTIETRNVTLGGAHPGGSREAAAGAYVMLAMSDTGSGMDKATQARIFEPFFTTKDIGKGTGLGLSTVFGIVEQSGGYIDVHSEPGRGTTFEIYLPAVDAPLASAISAPPRRRSMAPISATVLLIEDEAAVRQVAVRILRKSGYEVLEAALPEDARRLCREHAGPIDLLLTDVVMPDVSGPELAVELLRSRPAMKVLYMSGYSGTASEQQGALFAEAAFLEKPFTPETLLNKVLEVLDLSED